MAPDWYWTWAHRALYEAQGPFSPLGNTGRPTQAVSKGRFFTAPTQTPNFSLFFLHRFDKGSELWANGINLFQIGHDIISKSNGKRTKNNQIYSWLLDKVAKRIKKINIDWMIINWLIGFDRFLSLEWRKLIVMKKVSLILLRNEISTLARNNSK